jgi:cytochrome c-type biogenesis protein CcmH
MKPFLLMLVLILFSGKSAAVDFRQLENPEQQAAYESLTSELRCLVCQNQTIKDSNAELASDLRRQVYEMLQQGKTKEEIVVFMTDRYGDFVLYNPPFKIITGLLWLGPAFFLLIGLATILFIVRRQRSTPANRLSAEQAQKIRKLLETSDSN